VIEMKAKRRASASGFTLIELMIVVAVVSIIVAIAVPTYQNQIRHSRRTDAKTALLDAAVREEKYLSLSNTYSATPANIGYTGSFPQNVGSGYYQIYVCMGTATTSTSSSASCTATSAATTGTSFVVAAIANAGTSQAKDSTCQYYAVDNTGTQYSSDNTAGTSGNTTTSTCWQ
jgi:type IV pilus assembly protein PilE